MSVHYMLRDDNGTIFLLGDRIELKIDNNRKVYVRDKKESTFYKHIGAEVPVGLSSELKQKYLIGLYAAIMERLVNEKKKKQESPVEGKGQRPQENQHEEENPEKENQENETKESGSEVNIHQ